MGPSQLPMRNSDEGSRLFIQMNNMGVRTLATVKQNCQAKQPYSHATGPFTVNHLNI